MIKSQKCRPTEQQFMGAAFRYIKDDYYGQGAFYNNPIYRYRERELDEKTIQEEWKAEGIGSQNVEQIDMEFAVYSLLAVYQRSRGIKRFDELDPLVL